MNDILVNRKALERCILLLRVFYGLAIIAVGIHKLFFKYAVTLQSYLHPTIVSQLTAYIAPLHLFYAIGVFEVIVGFLILNKKTTQLGAYLMILLLLAITINLAAFGMNYDVIVRAILLMVSLFVLARLTALYHSATRQFS